MALSGYEELVEHIGCDVEIVGYGSTCTLTEADIDAGRDDDCTMHPHTTPVNAAIECITHGCILLDYDQP
jgi:hypothetical protein